MKTDNETKQQVLSFEEFMEVFRDKLLDAHANLPVTLYHSRYRSIIPDTDPSTESVLIVA